jgi:type 1 glutamine amidotransferase
MERIDMNRRALLLLLACLPVRPQQNPPPQTPSRKIQVLIVTGRDDHDWRGATPLMRQYLDAAGIFETRIAEEFRDASPESLKPYDVAVLVYADKFPEDRWTDRSRAALLDFVRSGKGLVVYHHSSTAFKDWPEFARMCGGNYYGGAHHSPIHDFTVDVVDRDHPITRGLKKSFAQPQDELYANMQMQPAGSYHVLATAWDDHALYHGKSRVPITGPGANEPLLWTVEAGQGQAGKGRVFATMIGHSAKATQSPGWIATFTRGVEWAATGNVTQPVAADMAEQRSAKAMPK